MWSATQIPHILRFALAATTGVPESKIRVIAPDVGGGFGGKLQTTPEEWIAWAAARRLGKPVKYTETRSESRWSAPTTDATSGRSSPCRPRRTARSPGSRSSCSPTSARTSPSSAAAYRCSARSCTTRSTSSRPTSSACQTVLTNTTWTDAYRGAGRPGGDVRHRAADGRARRRGRRRPARDPREELDQRRRVPVHDRRRHGVRLRRLRGRDGAGQGDVRVRRAARRADGGAATSGDPVQLGIGVSTFTEMCGLAPSRVLGSLNYGAGGWEHASVRMLPTGKVEVITGACAHGQGHETAFSQIVADRLGVAFEDVEVLHGDTQVAAKGYDTYGSRSLVVGGEALVRAADKVDREGQADRGAPARGVGRRHRVRRRPVRGPGHRPGHGHRGARDGGLRGAQPARRGGAVARLATRRTTRSTSTSRTARTCARWRSTPRPAR